MAIEFIDKTIARRLEEAHSWRSVEYTRAQANLQPQNGCEIEAVADGFATFAGKRSPLNKASGIGFAGPITAAALDRIERFYRRNHVLPRIELCPLADDSLRVLLGERGYCLEQFFNVYFCEVGQRPYPIQLPPDTTLHQAQPDDADEWINVTTRGFEGTATPSQLGLEIQAPNFYSANTTCYLVRKAEKIVAGGVMATHNKVTELGGTSTLPAYRCQGLQTALLHVRLNTAREIGCEFALVLTTPGTLSQRNIERVGFRLAYTKAVMVGKWNK